VGLASAAPACATVADLLRPEEGRLDNGLRVLTLADPSAPVLSFQVWYDVGSRNERPGITGISHFFEHLMFTGSENFGPDEHARRIEEIGGASDAYTTWDVTVYTEVVPAEYMELCAELEADRMRSLQLTEEKLETQRQITLRERRIQIQEQPLGRALEELIAVAFEGHPYGWITLGSAADIGAISLEDLREFYEIHYAPDNATVVVCGPVSHGDVMNIVKRHFGQLRGGRRPAPEAPSEGMAQEEERRVQAASRLERRYPGPGDDQLDPGPGLDVTTAPQAGRGAVAGNLHRRVEPREKRARSVLRFRRRESGRTTGGAGSRHV
jgi:predicted Zn-dependent peptidase